MYQIIFFTNVLKHLQDQGMTKKELSERSEVSESFVSMLTNGPANPSLRVMEQIAEALGVPLTTLLETTDWTPEQLEELSEGKKPHHSSLPPGFERVSAILPEHQAFLVRQWHALAVEKLHKR